MWQEIKMHKVFGKEKVSMGIMRVTEQWFWERGTLG